MMRPLWNGPDRSDGKNVWPVSAAWLAAGSFARTPLGARRCAMGFTPRTEANSDENGGSVGTSGGGPPGSVRGRVLDRPAIISVNTTPMETAVPEFWKVERIPDAAPRSRAGTEPMIEDEFGAANIPLPIPFSAMNSANA